MLKLSRIAALVAMLVFVMAASAQAATYTVTTTNDDEPTNTADCPPNATDDDCSLREAVESANLTPENDTINVPAGEYVLRNDEDDDDSDADLNVEARNNNDEFPGTLTIVGNSARDTTIRSRGIDPDGNLILDRIFEVEGGQVIDPDGTGPLCLEFPGANLEIRNLRVTRGHEDDDGGAISVEDGSGDCDGDPDDTDFDGRLTVRESAVTNSYSEGNEGGGIYSAGEVSLINSLVASNSTASGEKGGGIRSEDSLSLLNTTLVGNRAGGQEGGAGGALSLTDDEVEDDETTGVTDATNVTIAFNEADTIGGAVHFDGPDRVDVAPVFNVKNTIIAGNRGANGGQNCTSGGQINSLGNNLEDRDTCGFDGSGDRPTTDAGLLGRANNGGPTDTLALRAESPAIDAGTNDGCPSTDQRLVTRPQGAGCDIGAYEFVPPPPGPPPPPPPPPTVIRETVQVPTAFPRVRPRGLTLAVRKTRPTRRSVRLRSSGRVLLPAGLTAAQACTFGVVAVQVKANGKTVSTRITEIRRNCRFSSQVTFNKLRRIRGRTLTVQARFYGNDRLRARFSRKRSAGRG